MEKYLEEYRLYYGEGHDYYVKMAKLQMKKMKLPNANLDAIINKL